MKKHPIVRARSRTNLLHRSVANAPSESKNKAFSILSVVGARPQFVKAAVLSKKLRRKFREVLVHTGQHYDFKMSQVFFKKLKIPKPDYNLGIGSGSHAEQTAKAMLGIEKIALQIKPDAVLVYGDTNSTLAGALVGAKLQIPVFHVEAGLRSYDRQMPEEINRVLTDHLSTLLLSPHRQAVKNLKNEGIAKNVYEVGNLMTELLFESKAEAQKLQEKLFKKHQLKQKKYIFATVHRASNTDDQNILTNIINAFSALRCPVIFPAHPRTVKMLQKFSLLAKIKKSNIRLIEPVSYLESIALQMAAQKVITDSGGIQHEAFNLGVPCLTLRDTTEWSETVKLGWNKLVDPASKDLTQKLKMMPIGKKVKHINPKTSEKIVKIIGRFFKQ